MCTSYEHQLRRLCYDSPVWTPIQYRSLERGIPLHWMLTRIHQMHMCTCTRREQDVTPRQVRSIRLAPKLGGTGTCSKVLVPEGGWYFSASQRACLVTA